MSGKRPQVRRQSSGGESVQLHGEGRPERKARSYAASSLSYDGAGHGPMLRKADHERRLSLQARGAGKEGTV